MRLIVDSNILADALIKRAATAEILLHPSFTFYLPEYSIQELNTHWDYLASKSKLPPSNRIPG